jgi:hypothetical protein
VGGQLLAGARCPLHRRRPHLQHRRSYALSDYDDNFDDNDDEDYDGDYQGFDDSQGYDDAGEPPAWQRYLDLALAAGFMLRTKAGGWKLFCERMTVPPFAVWEGLPGLDRLQRALQLAEKTAFGNEGFLRWLNAIRPAGEPERAEVPLTVEGMAAAAEELFRQSVQWWGG